MQCIRHSRQPSAAAAAAAAAVVIVVDVILLLRSPSFPPSVCEQPAAIRVSHEEVGPSQTSVCHDVTAGH